MNFKGQNALRFISIKIILFTIFNGCFYHFSFAQNQLSPATKRFLYDLEQELSVKNKKDFTLSASFISQYDLYPKNGDFYVGALILKPQKFPKEVLKAYQMTYSGSAGDIHSCKIPVSQFKSFILNESFILLDIGDPVDMDLQLLLPSMRVDSVHQGLGSLSKSYSGKGTIIGIIDWGFDYTHPMFYDSTMENYRVIAAWDQNKLSGPPPPNFDFGTAYETKDDLLLAGSDTLYLFGPISHGTHVAGIAGGGGAGTKNIGVAPEAELIFISLRRDAASLMDAYLYIQQVAKKHNKPFVVNMSFGTHLGPHDGMDLKNKAIDEIVGRGKISVGSAGNNGRNTFHILHSFKNEIDTLKTVVGFNSIPGSFGQTLSMWGSPNSTFKVRFKLLNANNTIAFNSPWVSSSSDSVFDINYSGLGFDSLFVRYTITQSFITNHKPNIRAEVRKLSNLRLLLEVVGEEQEHIHIWNNVRLYPRYTNWGVALTDNYPNAKAGDDAYGVGEPGGVGKSVLTVGSYRPERLLPGDIIAFGWISDFSSFGPTTDHRRKPDISGPGHFITSSVNSYDETATSDYSETVEFNGKTYGFAIYSGTSMSGPAVAGLVALLLEKNPTLDHHQIKQIITKSARLDNFTGDLNDTSSLVWGFGKANAYTALIASDAYPIFIQKSGIKVYPNPASSYWDIESSTPLDLKLYNSEGKLIYSNEIKEKTGKFRLDNTWLANGLYIVHLSDGESQTYFKLIKASGY